MNDTTTRIKNLLTISTTIFLKKIEKCLLEKRFLFKFPPVFIVGCPRSGSTLLYQLITRHFNVCYFSNLMMLFPDTPICTAKILSYFDGCNPPPMFHNRYGFASGWNAPNQGLKFWKRMYPDTYGPTGSLTLSEEKRRIIRNTIGMLQNIFNAPFINKFQPLSEKIADIADVFNEALFIRIKRDPVFTAQSILMSKRDLWKDDSRWFSTRPRNFNDISKLSPIEQVCNQIDSIETDMDRDFETIEPQKLFTVCYEELCRSPRTVMVKVKDFYKQNSALPLKTRSSIPRSFINNNKIKLSLDEFELLESHFLKK